MSARHGIPTLALVVAVAGCSESTAPDNPDFDWSGTIAQGDVIEIKGINGSIIVSAASGNTVSVSAVKDAQDSDPTEVDIEVVTHAEGVTICAVYPDVAGQPPNECAPGNQGHMSTQDNDVEVTFWVSVPAGVDLVATTINGSVSGTSLESNAFATTVNGDVSLTTTQLATASTVNGTITVTIGLADWDRNLNFLTVNGNIRVEVPSATNAEVRLVATNGSISSDFTLTQFGPSDFRGTLGSGGWNLLLTTVNGNVALESGS